MVCLCRHASVGSSLFIRKMLVAARAHYFHCQKVSPLLYFEFAMDGISNWWKVQQQVKDLLKPGGKSSGKEMQEKCGHQRLQRMKMAVMPTTIKQWRRHNAENAVSSKYEWVNELPCNCRCQQLFHSHSQPFVAAHTQINGSEGTCT